MLSEVSQHVYFEHHDIQQIYNKLNPSRFKLKNYSQSSVRISSRQVCLLYSSEKNFIPSESRQMRVNC